MQKTEYEWRLSSDGGSEYYVDLREDKIYNNDTISSEYISGNIFSSYKEALLFYEQKGKENYLWYNEVDTDMKMAVKYASSNVACLLDQNYDSQEELEQDLLKLQKNITVLENHILNNNEPII
tara:strand:+ start:1628 stop:1996 length:369 start_codon:yes stop_codon:yes gene_type:complete